jgi:hypothetical protein
MDLHKESISIAVMNAVGKIVMECVIETKANMILQCIDGLRGDLHVTFEEGTSAAWLYDLLKPHVTELIVCDPRKNASMREDSQNDKIDARRLAELLRIFFIQLETRRVNLAGFTPYPDQEWMEQQARNATMEEWGFLRGCRYLLHDHDTKFCASFRELIESGSVKTIRLPARSANLNSFAERWVRSVKEECLSRLCLGSVHCGERCSNMWCITMRSATTRVKRI